MSFHFPTQNTVDEGFSFGENWDKEAYKDNLATYPSVCYKYLQMSGTYGFDQKEWDNRDAVAYFKSMSILARMAIREFQNLDKEVWHLNSNKIAHGQNLYNELLPIFGKEILNAPERIPPFFHFALYQDKGVTANRDTGVKSPRIYFFIGDNATIYPMFYDPYHEINP